ncbi:hypothetical protein [Paraliomyxa miuraensis]|uniref:hypothetical protein n=1 Tax=Paraliomyxa miuraensis TaxID=376150 RepID=UPI0022596942|nr:hypothetical protein [Paraliomyxa miuraensis]MCX4244521.1 hypothetical protein [Paraliomyxa miuraensis]
MDEAQPAPAALPSDPWQALFHRWFIQYNPLYLISAALVLVGVILLSHELGSASPSTQLGITAIAEVYAWALIGSAALLVRIHLRRPAVMLALLAALYQCDPTLHTATCAHLGLAGIVGSAVWLASFVAKLRALVWAMQLRASSSAIAVASLGASILAAFPLAARALDGPTASSLLGACLFALAAAGLWTSRQVRGRPRDDAWATTVTRRSLRATWAGWALMMLVHVGFWLTQIPTLHATALVPAACLLWTRFARRETTTWIVVGITLLYVGLKSPSLLSLTALMATATLCLRALRQPHVPPVPPPPIPLAVDDDVYRREATEPAPPTPLASTRPLPDTFVLAPPRVRRRLLTGALGTLYLSVWCHGWAGGPWPGHVWWLDLLLLGTCLALAGWNHWRLPLILPSLGLGHWVVSLRLVPTPQSAISWGVLCVGLGFGLLLCMLVVSVRWRHRQVAQGSLPPEPCVAGPPVP